MKNILIKGSGDIIDRSEFYNFVTEKAKIKGSLERLPALSSALI